MPLVAPEIVGEGEGEGEGTLAWSGYCSVGLE